MAVEGQRFMTKTQHYRKITKPLLERKRRARMNLYLDELKDLIVDTMEAQGEHVTKLEKADILEMTVNYLKSRKHEITSTQHETTDTGPGSPNGINLEKFQAGYTQAAYEVSKVFSTLPGLDLKFGSRLIKHLGYQLKDIKKTPLNAANLNESQVKLTYPITADPAGNVKQPPSQLLSKSIKENAEPKGEDVWRPW